MLAAMRISTIEDINPSTTKTESVKHKKQMQKKKKNPTRMPMGWDWAFNIYKWKKRQEVGAEVGKGCGEYWMPLKKIFEEEDNMIRYVWNLC